MRLRSASLFIFLSITAYSAPSNLTLQIQDHALVTNNRDALDPTALPSTLLLHEDTLQANFFDFQMKLLATNALPLDGVGTQVTRPLFYLEKKSIQMQRQTWEILLGDSYQEFGRGIALSLNRIDVFGVNNTLEGASFRFHPTGWDISAFAGRVNALRLPVAVNAFENPVKDRTVWLVGTSAKANVGAQTHVGSHYLLALNQPQGSPRANRVWHTIGASVSNDSLIEGVDLYGESNVLISNLLIGRNTALPTGYGTYLAADWVEIPWRIRWEMKDYRNYSFDFRRPPTLEEDIIAVTNTEDVTAHRFQVDHRFLPSDLSVQGSFLAGHDRLQNAPVYHGVVGVKNRMPNKTEVELRGGYRIMPDRNNTTHASAKLKLPTLRGQAIEFTLRKQSSTFKLDVLPAPDDRNTAMVTYTFSERFNLSLGYEFVPTNDVDNTKHFFNIGGTYQTSLLTARAFIGQTSGGTVCAGGVCRQIPPYTGAMLETYVSF